MTDFRQGIGTETERHKGIGDSKPFASDRTASASSGALRKERNKGIGDVY